MSVGDRFRTLLERIQPNPLEVAQYQSHLGTVSGRLRNAFPDCFLEVIGSHSRGSAVRQKSDLDLLVRLPREYVTWGGRVLYSDTVLNNLRAELQDRYTQTEIRRDGQAVALKFGGGAYSVDVVPAIFDSMVYVAPLRKQRPLHRIPDGNRGWLTTSPSAHNDYISIADKASGGKLTYVAQLIKFWRSCRMPPAPISSFHVDLLLAESAICSGVKSYASCVTAALLLLAQRGCRALQDPLNISGLVAGAATGAKREQSLATVAHGAIHARNAIQAEARRDLTEAYRQWDIVFWGEFPKK